MQLRKERGLQLSTLSVLMLACRLPTAASHGLLTNPRQRGALVVKNRLVETIDEDAPFDPYAHFPSGDKSLEKGAGKRSVVLAANNNWAPYEPLRDDYEWRAGVCGDEKGKPQEHLKGGKYFYPADSPKTVQTYNQGDVIDIESNIVVHHNGFFEFHVCSIDTCGGDISEDCFRFGHCQKLLRAASYCDTGNDEACGPIDKRNPGRWYLPCGPFPEGQIIYGGNKGSMKYKLPDDLHCDHCVIQWYWTGANTCNPPGVVEYFEGEDKPNWPDCKGQGGALGGYTKVQKECKGKNFPEEYWQCADVRIMRGAGVEGDALGGASTLFDAFPFDPNNIRDGLGPLFDNTNSTAAENLNVHRPPTASQDTTSKEEPTRTPEPSTAGTAANSLSNAGVLPSLGSEPSASENTTTSNSKQPRPLKDIGNALGLRSGSENRTFASPIPADTGNSQDDPQVSESFEPQTTSVLPSSNTQSKNETNDKRPSDPDLLPAEEPNLLSTLPRQSSQPTVTPRQEPSTSSSNSDAIEQTQEPTNLTSGGPTPTPAFGDGVLGALENNLNGDSNAASPSSLGSTASTSQVSQSPRSSILGKNPEFGLGTGISDSPRGMQESAVWDNIYDSFGWDDVQFNIG